MTSGNDMIEAAKKGDIGAVRRLAAHDPALCAFRAASGETPVIAALYRGHGAVVDTLVDLGAPLDIFAAAALGRIDILRARIAERPEAVNEFAFDGWTPLHLAAFFGHTEAAARLLDAGGAIDRDLAEQPAQQAVACGHRRRSRRGRAAADASVAPTFEPRTPAVTRRSTSPRKPATSGRRGTARARRRSARGRR